MLDTSTIQEITREFLMLSGILAWFAVLIWLLAWSVGEKSDRPATSLQLTVLDSDLNKSKVHDRFTHDIDEDEAAAVREIHSIATNPSSQFKSVGDWLDDAIRPRAQLQFIHRKICERAGVDSTDSGELASLIAEAVFDGFRQNTCIKRVDEASRNLDEGERQHA